MADKPKAKTWILVALALVVGYALGHASGTRSEAEKWRAIDRELQRGKAIRAGDLRACVGSAGDLDEARRCVETP